MKECLGRASNIPITLQPPISLVPPAQEALLFLFLLFLFELSATYTTRSIPRTRSDGEFRQREKLEGSTSFAGGVGSCGLRTATPRILDFQAAEKTFSVRARADSGACSTPRKDARCVSKAVAFAEPWPPNAKECEAWTALRGRHYSLRCMLRARLRKPGTLCYAPSLPDDPVVAGAHARLPPVRCNSRGPISFPFFVFS